MTLTAIYTGMRKSEIQALTWKDVDFLHATISITKSWDEKKKAFKPTKTESSKRTIKVNRQLLNRLADLKANSTTMVFQNVLGTVPTGAAGAIDQAGQIARPGAVIGRVGVPHAEPKSNQLFWKNIGLRGGIASVTKPDKELLLKAVLDGEINPGKVFTKSFDLDHAADAYAAMDQRQAIKSLLVID